VFDCPQNVDMFFEDLDHLFGPGGKFGEIVPRLQEFPTKI
jgi:hypothetical protein